MKIGMAIILMAGSMCLGECGENCTYGGLVKLLHVEGFVGFMFRWVCDTQVLE